MAAGAPINRVAAGTGPEPHDAPAAQRVRRHGGSVREQLLSMVAGRRDPVALGSGGGHLRMSFLRAAESICEPADRQTTVLGVLGDP
jgi:hypothetical protein